MKILKSIAIVFVFILSANSSYSQEVLKKAKEGTSLKSPDNSQKASESTTVDEKQTWERSRNPNYKEPEPAIKKEEEKEITGKSKNPQ
jgi:hypothetical protein